MSKLVRRLVKQLMQQINNLDNPHQSQYKTGHSTKTALLYIKNKIHNPLSHGEPNALVLIDLSTALTQLTMILF